MASLPLPRSREGNESLIKPLSALIGMGRQASRRFNIESPEPEDLSSRNMASAFILSVGKRPEGRP